MLRNDLFRPWFVGETDWGIEILSGEFSGVSLQITSIEFADSQDGNVNLDYHVVHKPEYLDDNTLKGPMFSEVLGLIINDILHEAVTYANHDRNNDSQEPGT